MSMMCVIIYSCGRKLRHPQNASGVFGFFFNIEENCLEGF